MSTAPHTEEELGRLLERVEEQERATRRRTIIYSFLPIVIGIAFLTFTAWQVHRTRQGLAVLESQRQALEQSVNVLRVQVSTYSDTLDQLKRDVNKYGGEQLQQKVQRNAPITTEVKLGASADKGQVYPDGSPMYKFSLWVDGTQATLARIAAVQYEFNHPTFPQAIKVQKSTDREH